MRINMSDGQFPMITQTAENIQLYPGDPEIQKSSLFILYSYRSRYITTKHQNIDMDILR